MILEIMHKTNVILFTGHRVFQLLILIHIFKPFVISFRQTEQMKYFSTTADFHDFTDRQIDSILYPIRVGQ